MSALGQVTQGSRAAERPVSEQDDAALVQAVRNGDERAFEELYGRYRARISAFVRAMVKDPQRSEDVTQEVFLSALRRLRQTQTPVAVKPWLYEIARNACIDQHRRVTRSKEVPLEEEVVDIARHVSAPPSPHAALNVKEQIDDLCDAFAGLSPVQHDMLVMREFEGRSYRDIGERLNLTKPAVESALFRARRRLMQEYQDLVSGERCSRIQRTMRSASDRSEPIRDSRMAMHVARCAACRTHARRSGLRFEGPPPRRRAAALLPLGALLPRVSAAGWRARWGGWWGGRAEPLARWSPYGGADTAVPGLITAGAAAATVALALGSAGVLDAHAPHTRAPKAPVTTVYHQPRSQQTTTAAVSRHSASATIQAPARRRGLARTQWHTRTPAASAPATAPSARLLSMSARPGAGATPGLGFSSAAAHRSGADPLSGGPISGAPASLRLVDGDAGALVSPVGASSAHPPAVGSDVPAPMLSGSGAPGAASPARVSASLPIVVRVAAGAVDLAVAQSQR